MTSPIEIGRRVAGRATHHLHTLPILALSVHSACNCRCVMCDIWMANAAKMEIGVDELRGHVDAIRRLHVQRVMLTGGEPLLHTNLWALCSLLREAGIHVTLVTTGLLVERHAGDIARTCDHLVVSIDGPPAIHDRIRRVPGAFDRIARGVLRLRERERAPRLTARSVVQAANCLHVAETIASTHDLGMDEVSFLAGDVSSSAFNRPGGWSDERRAEVAVGAGQLPGFAEAIRAALDRCAPAFDEGFVAGGAESLWRIHRYCRAVAGAGEYPEVRCDAPWVSAVLEPGGVLRPCFFHEPYKSGIRDQGSGLSEGLRPQASGPGSGAAGAGSGETAWALDEAINSPRAVQFRRTLDVSRHETCRRCVCPLSLPPTRDA